MPLPFLQSSLALPFAFMELSLSLSSSLKFSTQIPHLDASSHQAKRTIKPTRKLACASSKRSSASSSYSKIFFLEKESYFEPKENYGDKNIPFIRAYTQAGGDKFAGSEPLPKLVNFSHLIVRLARGYIIRASVLAFCAVTARTWIENAHLLKLPKWSLPLRALAALIALVCMDGFNSGINDIFDLEIDKINKPYLPIASGDLSLQSARLFMISFVAIGLLMTGLLHSVAFFICICLAFSWGVIYSVPPIRTKSSTIGAILTIALAKGCLFPSIILAAASATLGLPIKWSVPMTFITIFSTIFILPIGAMKDISDVEGDKMGGVPTLVSIIGARTVGLFGFGLLLSAYVGAIMTAICMPQIFRRSVMIPLHVILALRFLFQAWKLHKANYSKEESTVFYQLMWMLFDVEYIAFPFI